jgi:hypothetical protein
MAWNIEITAKHMPSVEEYDAPRSDIEVQR